MNAMIRAPAGHDVLAVLTDSHMITRFRLLLTAPGALLFALLAVPLSSQNATHLFDAARGGNIEIALHGHSHLHRGNDARGRRTEFSGLTPSERQRRRRVAPGTYQVTLTIGATSMTRSIEVRAERSERARRVLPRT